MNPTSAANPTPTFEDARIQYASPAVRQLREDLALALRAAAHHGLAEGVCNHFSVALPGNAERYLLNPRGLLWSEVGADDIVLIDVRGEVLAGRHRVEPTALTLTADRALDPTLSQNAMRYMGRIAIDDTYNGLALDDAEGERIARAMAGKDVAFLANHGVLVAGATLAHAYDDLYYLERACLHQVIAQSTGRPLAPVDAALAARVAAQVQGEREQSDLFFEALRRRLPAPVAAA